MMTKQHKVGLYARVSTSDKGQDPENQLAALRATALRLGWIVVGEYVDAGISGAKGREHRPAFDGLCRDACRGKITMVAAWSVDRLGRSLQDLAVFLGDLHAHRVDLYLHQQGIDTTTPGGKAMFQMMGVFAEFERAMIAERVCAGLDRARAKGKTLGRPTVVDDAIAARIVALRRDGASGRAIARDTGVSEATVRRVAAA